MNTNSILISGPCKLENDKVVYNIKIWATHNDSKIQFIKEHKFVVNHYSELWPQVKDIVSNYFNDNSFQDGAYTILQEHLIFVKNN